MISALFLLLFAAFLVTAGGDVSMDDSGEFALAAMRGEIPHPPGYPLYALVLWLAGRLPLGAIAFRVNLLGPLFAASAGCAAFLVWRTAAGRVFPGGPGATSDAAAWTGWVAAAFATLSLVLWGQAGTAKGGMYGLNLLLLLATLGAFWGGATPGRTVALGALFLGLSLANHWMSALGLVVALAWVQARAPSAGFAAASRRAVLAAGFVLLGLSLYLALPLCAARGPFLNWGTPDRLGRFLFVVLRVQYLGWTPGEEMASASTRLRQMGDAIGGTAPWWLVVPGAVAGLALLLRAAPVAAGAIAAYLAVLCGSLLAYGPWRTGAPWYMEIFSIPGTFVIFLLAAAAAALACRLLPSRVRPWPPVALAGALLLAIPGRWERNDRSRDYLFTDLALNLAAHVPRSNLFFAQSDGVVFGCWYAWLTGMRAHAVRAVPTPLLPMPWVARGFARTLPGLRAPVPPPRTGAEAVPQLLRAWDTANRGAFAIYSLGGDPVREAFGAGNLRPHGLVRRVGGAGRGSAAPPSLRRLRFRGLFGRRPDRDLRTRASLHPVYLGGLLALGSGDGTADGHALALAARLAREPGDRAAVALSRGNLAARAGRTAEAERLYLEAAELDPPQPVALRNLAMLSLREGRHDRALEVIKRLQRQAPESEEARELDAARRHLEGRAGDKR